MGRLLGTLIFFAALAGLVWLVVDPGWLQHQWDRLIELPSNVWVVIGGVALLILLVTLVRTRR